MVLHVIALAYIHEKGIPRRYLKPENVLLTTDNPPIVKVMDFGLAKIVDSITILRTMWDTPSYLAPEVITLEKDSGFDLFLDS
ncbi:kinase-like domain-containing protein [Mycena galopus ATCC 62051]|nr:kinase-like domain-containing protein [Mycena galopus ATCC 62051]